MLYLVLSLLSTFYKTFFMLHFITYLEAVQLIESHVSTAPIIEIALAQCYNYTLAEDIAADRDYPPFNRSAMDGIAIKYADFRENSTNTFTIAEVILAGASASDILPSGNCFQIMTGAAVPASADTVVKVEDCAIENEIVTLKENVKITLGQNIATQGQDCVAASLLLPSGTTINANVMGILASVGKSKVKVFKKPTVAIITTGDEVKASDEPVGTHQIRDSNSYTLIGLLNGLNIQPISATLISDDQFQLAESLQQAVENADIVIVTGGVSMGVADYVPQILEKIGVKPIFHKVKIKPGKPIWFGKYNETAVFALPGNPMSVQVTFRLFVQHYINKFSQAKNNKNTIALPLSARRSKKSTLDEFFGCEIVVNTEYKNALRPIATNGSGDIVSNLKSDGISWQQSDVSILTEGETVAFFPW